MNEMDIELLHMRGDAMPADALFTATDAGKLPGHKRSKAGKK